MNTLLVICYVIFRIIIHYLPLMPAHIVASKLLGNLPLLALPLCACIEMAKRARSTYIFVIPYAATHQYSRSIPYSVFRLDGLRAGACQTYLLP
jgi:hypothetical protein